MSSNNPKLTVYTMEGCGWCDEQKKEVANYQNKEFVNCTLDKENKTCKQINAFPTLSMKNKFYQGLHSFQEVLGLAEK